MTSRKLAPYVLRALAAHQLEGRRINLQTLVRDIGARQADLRRTVTALHGHGLVDGLRMRLTLSGFALGTALLHAQLPALRPRSAGPWWRRKVNSLARAHPKRNQQPSEKRRQRPGGAGISCTDESCGGWAHSVATMARCRLHLEDDSGCQVPSPARGKEQCRGRGHGDEDDPGSPVSRRCAPRPDEVSSRGCTVAGPRTRGQD